MRVLHVVATAGRRGAEVFASDLIRALEDGIDQHVAVLRADDPELTFPAETTVVGTGGWRVPGLRVDVKVVRGLRELIERWKPDVIQVHGGEPLKHTLLAAAGTGRPVIYRRIGPAPSEIARGARRAAHGKLMRRAESIVAVADFLRREVISTFGVPAGRVVTIPNAVDPSRLRPARDPAATRAEFGIPKDAPVVTSLGALTTEKDPVAHLEAAFRARSAVPELVHLVVGDGPLRTTVEAVAGRNGHGDRAVVAGSRTDVADVLAATDVLLLASRSEGLPACLIEAGMLGVPAVAFAVGGVPEVVVQGITGVLADPGHVDGLSNGLAELLTAPRRRREMGAAASRHCRAGFDIGKAASRYRELYEAVTG